ncbi:MAG TPA: hypothetical protein VKC90_07620 [Chitinophagaceae bacterium]|nr:hypothetical protein [Chitinophagaceae bacterium]
MKPAFIISFLLIGCLVSAQTVFEKQVLQIINDAGHNFESFKGEFKKISFASPDTTSVYYTTTTILGTKENTLNISNFFIFYDALVADSLKKSEAKRMLQEWKKKLNFLLSHGFESKKYEKKPWNPSEDGWTFSNGDLTVTLNLYSKMGTSSSYFIYLSVSKITNIPDIKN